MIQAGIVGGTGYTGVELLRLLALHPDVRVLAVTSRSDAGKSVDSVYPNLRGYFDNVFVEPELEILEQCDVVFYATPNGTAMWQAKALLDKGVKIIDLAADFRLKDSAVWEKWYGEPHACPELLSEAVYGLPEIYRNEIRGARLLANPGCYPTAVQLALLPLIEAGAVHPDGLIADVKSGASGAGRKAELSLLLSESGESFKAYSVGGHRHLPEILQNLTHVAGKPTDLTFVPHLLPMIRGIHATVYARVKDIDIDFQRLFETRYRDEPFVDVLPAGAHPDTRSVRGSNRCQLAVHQPRHGSTVVILAVIDNLVKGAAGQALQNMNLMFGQPETLGLEAVALYP